MTDEEKNKIQAHISTLDGVVTANISLKKKPNILTIHFRPTQINLRNLVDEVRGLGYKDAYYFAESEKADIRVVLQEEVNKFRNRFLISLAI